MTHGDPFGGAPFGQYPDGPPQYAGPPVFNAPPTPGSDKPNTFATLSLVFAFLFAPAGAILGHLGLAQIKRTGERGRDRALIGTVLSYVFTLVTVVALVIWGIIPGSSSAPPTVSTAASPPQAASATTTTTTSQAPLAPVVTTAQFPGLLLSLDEVKAQVNPLDSTYSAQDLTRWADAPGFASDPPGCVAGLAAGSASLYENSGATQTLTRAINSLQAIMNMQMNGIEERISLFPDAAAASAQAAAIEKLWSGCVGLITQTGAQTVKYQMDPVSRASIDPSIAVFTGSVVEGPKGLVDRRIARGVAARNNIVVEVMVLNDNPDEDAEKLAAAVLSRIPD